MGILFHNFPGGQTTYWAGVSVLSFHDVGPESNSGSQTWSQALLLTEPFTNRRILI